jgi:uncharacterized protein YndB with AHSA1/START domain
MNQTETTATSLRISRIIPAPIEKVFEAWTKPEILSKWAAPEGINHITYDVDLRVGGAYTLVMRSDEGELHTAVGEYREIDRPHRLVYTWDWKEDGYRMDVETLVTVEMKSVGDATEVLLTHELFPAEEAVAGHGEGWTSCLNRLEGIFA